MAEAINAFEGAVVLISHDPHLIELTADRLWLVNEGRCLGYDGDLDDYRRLLLDQRRERGRDKIIERADPVSRKEKRRAAAENRAATLSICARRRKPPSATCARWNSGAAPWNNA